VHDPVPPGGRAYCAWYEIRVPWSGRARAHLDAIGWCFCQQSLLSPCPLQFEVLAQSRSTLQHAQGRLGLGLAIVRRPVTLHGGTVRADSGGMGKGSIVTVSLALAAGADCTFEAQRKEPHLKPLRIVVVDDMPDNRESMALLLEVKGHAVRVAATGPEGLQVITEEQPDVALIDIGLPGFDGCELARRLRRRPELGKSMLVALTGYGNGTDKERALDAGFDAYIVKPFSFEAFVDCVEKAERAH